MRRFLSGLCAGVAVTGAAVADDARPRRPLVAPFFCPPAVPQVVCPPAAPARVPCPPMTTAPTPMPGGGAQGAPIVPDGGASTAPVTPITPDLTGTTPSTVPVPVPIGGGDGQFARGTERGGVAGESFNANMFGDILGARAVRIGYNVPFQATFGIDSNTVRTATGLGREVNLNTPGGSVRFGPTPKGDLIFVRSPFNGRDDLRFVQALNADGITPDVRFAQSALQTLLSVGGLTPAQIDSFNQLTPDQRQQLLRNRASINRTITDATKGLAVQNITVAPVTAGVNGGFITYDTAISGEQNVPLPGGSTYVGRLKMSEDTSPLPRDRLIFTYDLFDNVPFTPAGFSVNRFQFGVEKTFFDGRWSFEFRMPWAATIASTNVQGFEGGDTEFGNLRFALKRIATRNRLLTTSTGIAVTLPTADDQVVLSSLDFQELYRFRNESVTVEPFVAALYTPTERLFSQTWASINFDVSGGELRYNTAVFGGSGSARLYDVPYLSVDHQVGYWLIQRDTGTLRRLAPFAELHWNYAIAQNELIGEVNSQLPGNGLSAAPVATHELNLVSGLLMQIDDRLNLSLGAAVPLLQRPDRTFNWQIGLRANYLFGRTARARDPIYAISSY